MMNAYARRSLLAVPLLAGLGCSDPVPPPAQAAITLEIGQPNTPVMGKNCPEVKTYQVGAFDSKTMMTLAPSLTTTPPTPGQSVISGENHSTINCSVTGSGGNFKFSGSINAVSANSAGPITVNFLNGVINGTTGTADVSVYTTGLLTTVGPAPCTFQIVNGQIKGGSMWASFSCPDLESSPSYACGILQAQTTVVFENCSGS